MQAKIIDKSQIGPFLDELIEKHTVIAPIRESDGISFGAIDSADQVILAFSNTKKIPKSVFFPREEVMFAYSKEESGTKIVEPVFEGDSVLFGLRPCDARSFLLLDAVFGSEDFKDVYYLRRREGTRIIGLACNHPRATCFCTTMGGGPFNHDGMDVLLTDLGDRYLAEAVTDDGEEMLASFPVATEADKEKKNTMREDAEKGMKPVVADLEGLRDKLDASFESDFWDQIHFKCLGCTTCTYLCPTCHCFDIYEEQETDKNGYRVRLWDACSLSLFTLHTSGHNPRPSSKERIRQRVMHKFNYFPHNYGEFACVGCGRCVQNCPVNMDIRDVISSIARL